jgi:hypothetical protein
MLVGRTGIGLTPFELATNTLRTCRLTVPQASLLAKGAVYLDGLGTAPFGDLQLCRQVIYDVNESLVAVSDQVIVQRGQQGAWVDFPYSIRTLSLDPGVYSVGVLAGDSSGVIRVFGSDPAGAGGRQSNDNYGDGADDPYNGSGLVDLTADMSQYLQLFSAYSAPNETDIYFSRLPYLQAQAILGKGGGNPGTRRLVSVGWHDTFVDPERGSNGLVRDGGKVTDLLGERIRLTTQQVPMARTAVVYVHNIADADAFPWDLSVTRHVFGQLAMLATTTIPVVVEVIT